MAENPVWVDKTGNGHDLQMKNFSWGGMSGVGGYVDNWNSSADWGINNYWVNSHTDHKLQLIKASTVVQMKSKNIYNAETESISKNLLTIGYSGNDYTKIAFRNLAIYPTVLSKEDCIKAYNYLQTLKAK